MRSSRCLLFCVAVGLICFYGPTMGQNLIQDGSFEQGNKSPIGWKKGSGSILSSNKAYRGRHSIGGKNKQTMISWTHENVMVEKGQSYRLSGWLSAVEGKANIGMDVQDKNGIVLETITSAIVIASSDTQDIGKWRYVSVEHDMPDAAYAVSVWLRIEGEGYLDEVILAPQVTNLVFNPEFNGDRKNRVSFWNESPLLVLPGTRSGSHAVDPSGGRKSPGLMVTVENGWRAVQNIPSPIPDGITLFRFNGWSRCDKGEVEILILWLDESANIIKINSAKAEKKEGEWTHYVAENIQAPETAIHVAATVVVRTGRAWFDDFDLRAIAPVKNKRPNVRVHVNQIGYETSGPKSLVVSSNFVTTENVDAEVRIMVFGGKEVMRVPLICAGRIHEGTLDDWDSYFWRADFSGLPPGSYKAIARIGDKEGTSPSFRVANRILFNETVDFGVEFFYVQRCGYEVLGWHGACHLDDAILPDKTHIDATGGWHSAGDYNKLMYENGDGGVVYALLTAYMADPVYFEKCADGLPAIIDEAIWGAQFVARMQIPQTGGLYNHVNQGPGRDWMKWSPPEDHTDNVIGTADDPIITEGEGSSPLIIGGWARLAALLDMRGISNNFMDHALRLWDHDTDGGKNVGGAHLLISAIELNQVTESKIYLDFARKSVESLLASQVKNGRMQGAFGNYGEYTAGALAIYALTYQEDPLCEKIKSALRDYIGFCVTTADNPFGLAKQQVGATEFFFEPTSTYGHNFEILIRAWAAKLIHKLTGDDRALVYATDQLDWILGKNPFGLCMFEGKGSFNPPRYHHRYDSILGHETGAVPGCVPNGFVRNLTGRDRPGFDLSRNARESKRASYRTSEPWLVHNMWFLMAISAWR